MTGYIISGDVRQALIDYLAESVPHVPGIRFLQLWNALQHLPEAPEAPAVPADQTKRTMEVVDA